MKRYIIQIFLCLSALVSLAACSEKEPNGGEKPDEPGSTSLSVSPTNMNFTASGGSKQFNVKSDGEWTVSVGDASSWCSVDVTSGKGDAVLTVSASANDGERRTAYVVLSSKGLSDATVKVIQNAAELKYGLYSDPETPDADAPCTLYYRADLKSKFYGWTKDVYAHIGIVEAEWMFVQADWNVNIDKCKMTRVADNLWSLTLSPTIRDWFGSGDTSVSKIGIVLRSADGSIQTADLFQTVTDSKYQFEPGTVVKETLPAGVKPGINYNADGSVTFVLLDRNKDGKSHDWCYLVGEFTNWKRQNEYMMKLDETAGCWWYTMTDAPSDETLFQYYLGDANRSFRVHDPYSEIVYGSDDKWISSSTYPGLRAYPEGTSGLISAFEKDRAQYPWTVNEFSIKDKDNLVIYEMHLRDFSSTGDIAGALDNFDKIDFGINAIELMPVQEFDGNDSWGYNPCSYFALDKAYGTRDDYKKFIDECHKRGWAVIVDVVYNQATGAHPMAKLWWDADNNCTAKENPWFNVCAPHPYSVFHDWNHENKDVVEHISRSLEYLLTEYKVDGFRFDLTKGFTNKSSTEATASNYDASRVAILKNYNSVIKAVNPDAVVILEHFCCDQEEKELIQNGMKVWRNGNWAYSQAAQGYSTDSAFNSLWTGNNGMPFGGYVGFMESHDEERVAYRQMKYGASYVKKDLASTMKYNSLASAFFCLTPGPKMIWQQGEVGYDVSIEENGRTGKKPYKLDEYMQDANRSALRSTYATMLKFRKDNPELFSGQAKVVMNTGSNNWAKGRSISSVNGGKGFLLVGNFTDSEIEADVTFPMESTWTVLGNSAESCEGNTAKVKVAAGEYKLFVNFK